MTSPYTGPNWPGNWGTGRVTGRFVALDGSPQVGSIKFSAQVSEVVAFVDDVIVPMVPVTVALDANGVIDIDLPASDSDAITPTSWTYTVTEQWSSGGGRSYEIEVHEGGTTHLSDFAAVESSTGTVYQFGLVSLEQVNARVDDEVAAMVPPSVAEQMARYQPLLNSSSVVQVADPTTAHNPATKGYTDSAIAGVNAAVAAEATSRSLNDAVLQKLIDKLPQGFINSANDDAAITLSSTNQFTNRNVAVTLTLTSQRRLKLTALVAYKNVGTTDGQMALQTAWANGASASVANANLLGQQAHVTLAGNQFTDETAFAVGTVVLAAGTYTLFPVVWRSSAGNNTDLAQRWQLLVEDLGSN